MNTCTLLFSPPEVKITVLVLQSQKLWEFRLIHIFANTWCQFNLSHASGYIGVSSGFICIFLLFPSHEDVLLYYLLKAFSLGFIWNYLLFCGIRVKVYFSLWMFTWSLSLTEKISSPSTVLQQRLCHQLSGILICTLCSKPLVLVPGPPVVDDLNFIDLISGSLVGWILLFFRVIFTIFLPFAFSMFIWNKLISKIMPTGILTGLL